MKRAKSEGNIDSRNQKNDDDEDIDEQGLGA